MLEIHPIQDENERKAYITEQNLPLSAENTAVLRAYENDETTGNIAMTVEGLAQDAVLKIHAFDCADDFTGELLIRAAVSYAFNRAVPKLEAPKALANPLFAKVGFQDDAQNISISTDKVVHFCKK